MIFILNSIDQIQNEKKNYIKVNIMYFTITLARFKVTLRYLYH